MSALSRRLLLLTLVAALCLALGGLTARESVVVAVRPAAGRWAPALGRTGRALLGLQRSERGVAATEGAMAEAAARTAAPVGRGRGAKRSLRSISAAALAMLAGLARLRRRRRGSRNRPPTAIGRLTRLQRGPPRTLLTVH